MSVFTSLVWLGWVWWVPYQVGHQPTQTVNVPVRGEKETSKKKKKQATIKHATIHSSLQTLSTHFDSEAKQM